MIQWTLRPTDEASLFNPAFCGLCLYHACKGFEREAGRKKLHFVTAFLILPIVLHAGTRARLPKTIRTTVAAWLEENPEALIGLAARCRAMIPHTREAILFTSREGLIKVSRDRLCVSSGAATKKQALQKLTEDTIECLDRAEFVGRWFTTASDIRTLMMMLGIRP